MKQHYLSLTDNIHLYQRAVMDCFANKWARNDILSFIEKYTGIPRHELLINELEIQEDKLSEHEHNVEKIEAIDGCALALEEAVMQILAGDTDDLDITKPIIRHRPDGMTGKIRDIALLCIMHQLLEHVTFILLEPLFRKRLFQTQHASIPKHGQTRLKNQVHRYLRSKLPIKCIVKTDMKHAYASVSYVIVIRELQKDIPDAHHIFVLLEFLGNLAPDGHLIIGGYLDAWLFNYVMSKVMRHGYSLGQTRRGKFTRYAIRMVTFMDDMLICTASIKAAKRVISGITDFAKRELGMTVKVVTGITKLLTVEEERSRKGYRKARRGCPVVDMGGYKISRSHVTVRRRIFIRVRRQFLRSWSDYQRKGTISLQRAQKLISYYGYIRQTNSANLIKKYHIPELMKLAKRIASFYGRLATRKRMEKLYDLRKRTEQFKAGASCDRSTSGWPAENYHFQRHLRSTKRRRNIVPVQQGRVLCAG